MNRVSLDVRSLALASGQRERGAGPVAVPSWALSEAGRGRLQASWADPLFYADWVDVVFLHFEADPVELQKEVPWPLDLYEGRAFVSLVAFTMRHMRPCRGGWLAALPFRPVATHPFLNVRVYVKREGEAAIHFLAEWVPNALSVKLGPAFFGLPYRLGRLEYKNEWPDTFASGQVVDAPSGGGFDYRCRSATEAQPAPCASDSLDEFLLERYTAFTSLRLPGIGGGRGPMLRRVFRIWHPPWPVSPTTAEVQDNGLLALTGRWSREAKLVCAHRSPGVPNVWMGRPHFVRETRVA